MYFVAQLLGAFLGAGVLYSVTETQKLGQYLCTPVPIVTNSEVFGYELIITFMLVLTYFASADIGRLETGSLGPLAIGLTVAMCHLWTVRILAACVLCRSWFILFRPCLDLLGLRWSR